MNAPNERIYRTGTYDGADLPTLGVTDLRCVVKKITTTNEGCISLAIELTATDDATVEQIRDLIRIQQGECLLSVSGVQGELPI